MANYKCGCKCNLRLGRGQSRLKREEQIALLRCPACSKQAKINYIKSQTNIDGSPLTVDQINFILAKKGLL